VIICRTHAEIEKMRQANQLVSRILAELEQAVAPGVSTAELDALAEKLTRDAGAVPAFKGYRGYPATLCASVNEQVVHGIPSKAALRDGDIVSLDIGVKLNGFYGDSAVTVAVGSVDDRTAALLNGQPGRGPKLAEGMVLAIEPMVAMGRPDVKILSDGWTAVTRDGSLAAHFEHTVAVGADGPIVLTRREAMAGARE
jgi:methionyl aminopeptidase